MIEPTYVRKLAAILLLAAAPVFAVAAQPVTQPFTFSLVPTSLPQVQHGAVAWGDIDGDGDLDALLSGIAERGVLTSIFRNDGKISLGADSSVVFIELPGALEPLAYSRAAWADYDRDGDLDLVMQGSRTSAVPYQPLTLLYRNDGGALTRRDDVTLAGLHSGVLKWSDVDNDGDLDLLAAGESADFSRQTHLYINNGSGAFSDAEHALPGFAYGDASFADFDGDGDLDLALSGVGNDGFISGLYLNERGQFAQGDAAIDRVGFASVRWADYDSDGDPDLVIAGGRITPFVFEGHTDLYENANGALTKVDAGFAGAFAGTASWGDYDNDGDADLLLMGVEEAFGGKIARLYENEASGSFRNTAYLAGAYFSAADWGDHEGDGDLDLLTTGYYSPDLPLTNLYQNERQVAPPSPAAPKALHADVAPNEVLLRWESEGVGQSYNLRVGTSPGAADIVAAHSDPVSGKRLLSTNGNAGSSARWLLAGLEGGTYYWSVQALNAAYQGSKFADEGRFTVSAVATSADEEVIPAKFSVKQNYPNPFAEDTMIRIELPTAERVLVEVFDILGRRVAGLTDSVQPAGHYTVSWNGQDDGGIPLSSGVYFYRVRAKDNSFTGRMIVRR